MTIRKLLILFLIFFTVTLFAQNGVNTPASLSNKQISAVEVVELQNTKLIIPVTNSKTPSQAGYTIAFTDGISKGMWDKTSDGYLWRLELYVPDAFALNLYIHDLNLNDDESLFLYDPMYENTLEIKNFGTSTICTDFIFSDRIILELNTSDKITDLPFNITEVGVLISDETRGFGDAGSCEVFVNCKEGESWQQQKKGVARILVKEGTHTFWCTGSLINNTNNDGKPLFLTANHCGEEADSTDYSEWLFYFNYESEYCGEPVNEPEYNTISGSYLLSKSINGTTNSSDFKLLKLAQNIPAYYKPFYNGWDRRGIASPSGVSIHHPQGDIKMISTYTESLVSTKYDNTNVNPNGEYWLVSWAETENGHGVTEGGSSGSPLFNMEGNIVGTLTGGRASCSNENLPDFYGKLSYSWDNNRLDSTDNLAYWLDPLGSGLEKLKGTNLDSSNIYAGFSADTKNILVGESVEFVNTSFGNIIAYEWYFEGGDPAISELEDPASITYNEAGLFDVQLIVFSGENSDTLFIDNYINVLPNMSPNPSDGEIKLTFGGDIPADYTIRVFNSIGQETGYRIKEIGGNYLIIEFPSSANDTFFVNFISSEITNTYKVIVIGN